MKTILGNAFRRLRRLRVVEVIFAKLLKNRTWDSKLIPFSPAHLFYPPDSIRHAERHGINYVLDMSDLVDWSIFMSLSDPVVTVLRDLLKPGMTCIDCGANVGYVSFAMAQEVGENGRVLSFEPFPGNASRFERNLAANVLPQLELQTVGIGAESGRLTMSSISENNAGMNRISGSDDGGVSVEIVTLDDFAESERLDRVDLLKIDVEGYEGHVLRGGMALLQRFRPILVLELNDRLLANFGTTPRDVLSPLEALSYQLTDLSTGAAISSDSPMVDVHLDVLATPPTSA